MLAAAGLRVRPRDVVRAVTHLARWVDYHSAGATEASGSPARLSFYSSSAPPSRLAGFG